MGNYMFYYSSGVEQVLPRRRLVARHLGLQLPYFPLSELRLQNHTSGEGVRFRECCSQRWKEGCDSITWQFLSLSPCLCVCHPFLYRFCVFFFVCQSVTMSILGSWYLFLFFCPSVCQSDCYCVYQGPSGSFFVCLSVCHYVCVASLFFAYVFVCT